MFLPKDHDAVLQLPKHREDAPDPSIESISLNSDGRFIATVSKDSVYIWLVNPALLLCSISTVAENWNYSGGELRKVYWKHDSSIIAVTTNQSNIFFYKVTTQESDQCYNFIDSKDPNFQRNSHELFLKCYRPVVTIKQSMNIKVADIPTCCVPSKETLFISLKNGFSHHITWNGQINAGLSFRVTEIPFAYDQLQSKAESLSDKTIYIHEARYAPLLGGYAVVLSNGYAGLVTSPDPYFSPETILGVWAINMKDAVCCDANHAFRLAIFGCQNGDVCAYNIDEQSGSFIQAFRLAPKVTNGPDFSNRLGPVRNIRATSNGNAFAAIWDSVSKPTENTAHALPPLYAVFSSFGAQLFCNLEGLIEDSSNISPHYSAIEWGPEGSHLWLGAQTELRIQPIARSATVLNPIMELCDRAVLIFENQILISSARDREADATAPHSVWDYITIAHEYLSSNWPLKYASVDSDYNHLVVAGTSGFAYCSLNNRKWKIFGNESQEKNLLVTGGVFVWNNDVIGVAGMDIDTDKAHVSFYPISQRLDNRYASVIELDNRPSIVAVRDDILAIFDNAGEIILFKLTAKNDGGRDSYTKVIADTISLIRIGEIVPHQSCVVSLQMTQLNIDNRCPQPPTFYPTIDTILVNIAGRLITFSLADDGTLHQPIVIASYVEKMWHERCIVKQRDEMKKRHQRTESNCSISDVSDVSSHLNNALWITCGAKGLKVWMPLTPGRQSTSSQDMTFMSKRIMLSFELDIYPVVISARDCLAVGIESQTNRIAKVSTNAGKPKDVSIYSLHRNSEVFVHHILRQLLKRNLGVFALEVAASCRSLPHFTHSLELLLHSVLEEEATCTEPIPDPFLPRCLAFIQEFPEFLKTVAHCARKTELALWPALFEVTGSPNALFEECLRSGKLETATSYVIVLQNFESIDVCMEQASKLIRAALTDKKWAIAQEMVRFARSIGSDDIDVPVLSAPNSKPSISRKSTVTSSTGGGETSKEFVVNRFQAGGPAKLSKVRHSDRKDSTGAMTKTEKLSLSRAVSGELSPLLVVNKFAVKMMEILEEHCWYLLNEYCICDLGFFISELHFDICALLENRRKNLLTTKPKHDQCRLIDDFPLALTRLHSQFHWPYPVTGAKFVHQIERRLANLKCSQSSASLSAQFNSDVLLRGSNKRNGKETEKVKVDDAEALKEHLTDNDNLEIQEALLEREIGQYNERGTLQRSPSLSSTNAAINPTLTPISSDSRSIAGDWQNTDYLVGEKSARGSMESNRQLEFMLDIFVRCSTIDWILLLCLIMRDERRFRHELSADMVKKVGVRSFARIRFACAELAKWAIEKCCGYVSLLQSFDAHLSIVAEQAGIGDVKYVPKKKKIDEGKENGVKNRGRNEETTRNPKLRETFGDGRRERSRSVDRTHRTVRRYEDVVCSDDALEKADEEGCSIM